MFCGVMSPGLVTPDQALVSFPQKQSKTSPLKLVPTIQKLGGLASNQWFTLGISP